MSRVTSGSSYEQDDARSVCCEETSFAGAGLSDPAARIATRIPLIPYYVYVMKHGEGKEQH